MFKIIIGLAALLTIISCTKKTSDNLIKDIKFESAEIDLSDFTEDNKVRNLENTIALKGDNKSVLRVHHQTVNSTEALKNINQKSSEIKLMFAPQQVPYMGQITKDIRCTEAVEVNNKIIENEKEISLLINLTATERLIYGSCIPEQEIFKSQLLLLYCKASQTFYEIKYFYDIKSDFKKQIAHCI